MLRDVCYYDLLLYWGKSLSEDIIAWRTHHLSVNVSNLRLCVLFYASTRIFESRIKQSWISSGLFHLSISPHVDFFRISKTFNSSLTTPVVAATRVKTHHYFYRLAKQLLILTLQSLETYFSITRPFRCVKRRRIDRKQSKFLGLIFRHNNYHNIRKATRIVAFIHSSIERQGRNTVKNG